MAKNIYRLTETVPVVRVYEIEANSEDEALDIMNSGKVKPVREEDCENRTGIKIEVLTPNKTKKGHAKRRKMNDKERRIYDDYMTEYEKFSKLCKSGLPDKDPEAFRIAQGCFRKYIFDNITSLGYCIIYRKGTGYPERISIA